MKTKKYVCPRGSILGCASRCQCLGKELCVRAAQLRRPETDSKSSVVAFLLPSGALGSGETKFYVHSGAPGKGETEHYVMSGRTFESIQDQIYPPEWPQ